MEWTSIGGKITAEGTIAIIRQEAGSNRYSIRDTIIAVRSNVCLKSVSTLMEKNTGVSDELVGGREK